MLNGSIEDCLTSQDAGGSRAQARRACPKRPGDPRALRRAFRIAGSEMAAGGSKLAGCSSRPGPKTRSRQMLRPPAPGTASLTLEKEGIDGTSRVSQQDIRRDSRPERRAVCPLDSPCHRRSGPSSSTSRSIRSRCATVSSPTSRHLQQERLPVKRRTPSAEIATTSRLRPARAIASDDTVTEIMVNGPDQFDRADAPLVPTNVRNDDFTFGGSSTRWWRRSVGGSTRPRRWSTRLPDGSRVNAIIRRCR